MLVRVNGYTIVVYKGTNNLENVIQDIRFLPWYSSVVGWCPAGFLHGVQSVMPDMLANLSEVAKEGKLGFVGHSLGGSEALIAAGWFAALGIPPAFVDAFEPAKTTMGKLNDLLLMVKRVTITWDGDDPVPDLPFPYEHPSKPMFIGEPTLNPIDSHMIAKVIADLA
jgi:hypothetical protein